MNKKVLLTLLLSSLSTAAFALDVPVSSRFDGRIQSTPYNVDDVVLVRAAVGNAVHILLSDGETVQEMATGNSEAWEIVDKRNSIYLKPKLDNANTNLIVTTNKRAYSIELQVVPRSSKRKTYRMTFLYPEEMRKADLEKYNKQMVQMALERAPVRANMKYTMQQGSHSDEIKPEEAFDDGRFTYVKFARNKDFPVIFAVSDKGEESIINSHVQGNYLVLHGVYKTMMIRGGGTVIGLYNEAYTGGGRQADTGTVSPNIQRDIKNTGEEK